MKAYSRYRASLRTTLATTCLSLLLAGMASSLFAQTLAIQAGSPAPDLQCLVSQPASRPTANPTPLEDLYEIPEEDVLLALIKALPDSTANTQNALSLFSKLSKSRPLNI